MEPNNKKILITSGPVWVPIDKVRVITNVFAGTLGWMIAGEAAKRGARVDLLAGPGRVCFPEQPPKNLDIVKFKFFDELYRLMEEKITKGRYDAIIHSAAVADYVPAEPGQGKIKSGKDNLTIELKPTLKIVDQIKKWDPRAFLVKFKLEVGQDKNDLIESAYQSMRFSRADLMVANDFNEMKGAAHKAFIIDNQKNIIECTDKHDISKKLLDVILEKI